MKTTRRLTLAVLILAALAILASSRRDFVDLRAFYCGGQIIWSGGDPYTVEPLRSCEDATYGERAGTIAERTETVLPAPLPAFALRMFALGGLPFSVTVAVYMAGVAVAFAVSVLVLHRLTGFGLFALAAVCVPGVLASSLLTGQLAPFVVALLLCAAAALIADRPVPAALCATACLIEPHFGAAACLSLFIFTPATRLPMSLFIVLLAAVNQFGNPSTGWERYLGVVLPHHAASEVHNPGQLSLTSLLALWGVSDGVALAAGAASFLAMLVAGIVAGRRLSVALANPAALVLVPAAFCTVGGSFVHLSQTAIALPAIIYLCSTSRKPQPLLAGSLVLLAIPWESMTQYPPVVAAIAIAIAAFGISRMVAPEGGAFLWIAALQLGTWSAVEFAWLRFSVTSPNTPLESMPGELASDLWKAYQTCCFNSSSPRYAIARLPTWIGLVAFAAGALQRSGERRPD